MKSDNLFKVKLDLKQTKKITSFCKENKINIIINCIALTNVELCEKYPKRSNETNFLIPSRLCNVAKKLNIKIVHISSDMLFDGKLNKKYTEKSKYSPINKYSITKVNAEKILLKYKKSLIIRSNFFGFTKSKNHTISDKLINQQRLKKISYLWNDIFFTPMYIPNLIFFMNLLIKKRVYGIYNISSDLCISKYNFGKKIINRLFKKTKIYPNSFNDKYFTSRPKNMCLSNNKIKKKFPMYKNKLKFNYQRKCFLKDFREIHNG